MALPYFKFYVNDYIAGDIQAVDMEMQGIFVNVCARIWRAGGWLPYDEQKLARLLGVESNSLSNAITCLTGDDLLIRDDDGRLSTKFIQEQMQAASDLSAVRAQAGRAGGRPKTPKAIACISDSDLDSDIKTPSRKKAPTTPRPKSFKTWTEEEFRQECAAACTDDLLTPEEVEDFIGYWEEKSATGRPRRAMQQTWDTRRRMQNAVHAVYERRRTAPGAGRKSRTMGKDGIDLGF